MEYLTLGSLFDGSGGFPLAGAINGITPVWASEIEPYPIRVTKARFPNMKHLGSVLDVKGDAIEPVDIITFGSPCQDLSVAGKQLGIHAGERSNLFFEAVRIAKEMRNHDRAAGRSGVDVRPRFLVWENVPGAFSSNQGEDFRSVLEALGGIAEDGVSIPRPPKGKWQHAGCVVGDGWSIAWRLYDAQYWGVPQRRKRIYLIADLASERAGEILFERESLCGNPAESGEAREGTADHVEGGAGGSGGVKCLNPWDCQSKRQYAIDGVYRTLDAGESAGGQAHGICYDITGTSSNSMKSPTPDSCFRERTVGRTLDTFVGSPECNQGGTVVVESAMPDVVYALQGNGIDRALTAGCNGAGWRENESYTLNTIDRHGVCYAPNGNRATDYSAVAVYDVKQVYSMKSIARNGNALTEMANPICASDYKDPDIVATPVNTLAKKHIVRRLTPLECCRLQGFPDWWEDGVEGSDSARYKMWGNGIALPCAVDVLRRIAKEL
jgi:DNA (cytosine-5)-methyltransferase 1